MSWGKGEKAPPSEKPLLQMQLPFHRLKQEDRGTFLTNHMDAISKIKIVENFTYQMTQILQ